MSELKIEVGKLYKCHDGSKAIILHHFDNPIHESIAFVGFLVNEEKQSLHSWYPNGNHASKYQPFYNLVSEWQEEPKVGWVYEAENNRTYKVVFDRKKIEVFSPYILVDIHHGTTDSADDKGFIRGSIGSSPNQLKLETGRPADE